jgi:enterochelin esterase family protein
MSTGTKVERILITVFTGLVLASRVNAQPPGSGRGGPQPPLVVSPQVLPDHRIVFRLLAPQAQSVRIVGTDIPSLAGGRGTPPPASTSAMKKAESGVWEVTVDSVPPGSYRYNFNVDGVAVIDPRNPSTSESNTNTWSLVHVPGAEFMDTLQVPHGGVTSVTYYSTALGRFRRMHVYTPPGYELGRNRLPVLYLLHGAGDSDASWSSVGRAGFILDNLIAAKKAKPMVVVMTAGHTSSLPAAALPGASGRDEFADDFVTDVMPYIERTYRVLTDRPNRAMAGLSMGGSQTLNIAFQHLDKFAYLGIFSSGAALGGGQIADWESAHKVGLDDASLKKGLRLLSFSTGVDDFVLPNSRTTVDMLKKHGFTLVFKESAGAHTWNNWRGYLNEYAQQLFQ